MRFFIIFPLWLVVLMFPLFVGTLITWYAIKGIAWLIMKAVDAYRARHGKAPVFKTPPPQEQIEASDTLWTAPAASDWTQANREWSAHQ